MFTIRIPNASKPHNRNEQRLAEIVRQLDDIENHLNDAMTSVIKFRHEYESDIPADLDTQLEASNLVRYGGEIADTVQRRLNDVQSGLLRVAILSASVEVTDEN